jgi:hypothetical protein
MNRIEVIYYNGHKQTVELEPVELQELERAARVRGNFRSLSGETILFKNVSHYYEV